MKNKSEARKRASTEGNVYCIPLTPYPLLLTPYFLLLTVYCLLSLSGCSKQDKMFKESRVLMDTFCTITVVSPEEEKAKEAIEAGFNEIKKLDKYLNNFSPDSEISAVSKSAGIKPVRVSKETFDLMEKTIGISDITNGAFDPTIAPVLKLWKFSGRPANPVYTTRRCD